MTDPADEGHHSPASPDAPLDFDPYRFGKPDRPIPPEYAPPGYVPPVPPPPPTYAYPPHRPPYGYPYPPGYEPQSGSSAKAIVALVLGILAILFSWASVWDLLFIGPAIVLGALARVDATRDPQRGGRGLATGGLVCGVVALLLAVVSTIYIYHRVKPCLDEYGIGSSSFQKCATDRLLGTDR